MENIENAMENMKNVNVIDTMENVKHVMENVKNALGDLIQ
mgnify:CR=1 FL=1